MPEDYETGVSSVLCEYCGHRPVQHEVIRSFGALAGSEKSHLKKRAKPAEEDDDGEEIIVVENAECYEGDTAHEEDDLVSSVIALFYVEYIL